jgi:hypothetical protein
MSFITPGFFWAGAALISIPLLIHFLNRRRFKLVQWAAMEYLLQALRKNRRRIKFEQIMLLVTRCLILAMLGLALARPLGCTESSLANLVGSKSGLHVFVIDNSYSMAYEADRDGAKTHFDQAKLLVKQQIEKLAPGGESVAIISAARPRNGEDGAPESQLIFRSSFNLDSARSAVDGIEQSFNGTDMASALQLAVQLGREEQKQPQKFVYLLTDCTRSAFENNQGDQLKQIGRELASTFGPRIRINDLSRQGQWNYAVLDIRPDGSLVTTNFHTDFLADVKGFGAGGETLVQWQWDMTPLEGGTNIRPDTGTQLQRQTKVDTNKAGGGPHVMSVTLVGDEKLKIDNSRQRVFEVAAELKVLIIEGERGTSLLSGSGAFLDLALAPKKEITAQGKVRSDSYVAPEVISDLEMGNKVLADYRAVILSNVASLSPAQADQVQKFVEQGGTFMTFMGEQVNSDGYNGVLLPRKLLPGKLVARKTTPDPKGFTLDFKPNAPLHPVLSVFRGEENSGLDTAPIYTYYQVEVDPESKAEIVLKFVAGDKQTEDPAITVHPLGKGRVVMVATTANGEWNSLTPKPAYVALIHELLAGTVDVGDRWMNLLVGQALEIPGGLKLTGAPMLTDPLKKPVPVDAIQHQVGGLFYRSKPLERPGIYLLNTGSSVLPIAVNVPADEADVRALPQDAMRKALGDIEVVFFGDTVPAYALSRDDSNDLGWSVMMIVLALVAAECFMAMSFGHYRRSGVRATTPATA